MQAKLKSFIDDDSIPELLGGSMAYTPQKHIAELLGPPSLTVN